MTKAQEKEIRLSYLWKKIILIAFNPSGTKEIFDWLSIYRRSVKEFWEISNYPNHDKFNIIVSNNNIPIEFDFNYNDLQKFSVKFLYIIDDENYSTWMHDVDKSYFSPEQPVLTQDVHMKKYLKTIREGDITEVLDGLLIHPTAHQHISFNNNEEENADDPLHDIRIGGGYNNPFQFLFHLRYQLCLIKEKREYERTRLISLFNDAIKKKCNGIAASKLLDIR